MITDTKILKKLRRVKSVENIFRQVAEEKPYLTAPFNEKKFHREAERILNKTVSEEYVAWWLSGFRKRAHP